MIYFDCPRCDERIVVDDDAHGSVTKCAECGKIVKVPRDEGAIQRLKDRMQSKRKKNRKDEEDTPLQDAALYLIICVVGLICTILSSVTVFVWWRF